MWKVRQIKKILLNSNYTLRLTYSSSIIKHRFRTLSIQGIRKFHLKQNFPFTGPILLTKLRVKKKLYDRVMTPPFYIRPSLRIIYHSIVALYDQTLLNSSPPRIFRERNKI